MTDGFRIDPATGQITVGPRTTLDADGDCQRHLHRHGRGHRPDRVRLALAPQDVTITVKNVNEAPMMTKGFTRNSQPEYDDDDTDDELR